MNGLNKKSITIGTRNSMLRELHIRFPDYRFYIWESTISFSNHSKPYISKSVYHKIPETLEEYFELIIQIQRSI